MTEPRAQSAPAGPADVRTSRPGSVVLALTLAVLILLPQLIRATVDFNPLPYWDSDPLTFIPAITGLTPATSMVLDLLVMGAALTALLAGWWPRSPVLAIGGAAAALALAYWIVDGTYTDARLASVWCSGAVGAVALAGLCREPAVKAVCAALGLGIIGLLLAKGAVQWFVEHPAAVENFKRHRALILASNGWEDGGSLAKGYERRLMQREASGWFGLANIYASLAAALTVALATLTLSARRASLPVRGALTLGAGASVAALAMAGSKGGLAAAILGTLVAILLIRGQARGRARALAWLGPGLCGLVMLGVVARGLLGDGLSELSLRFRWFYWQACAGMLPQGPTGPGGFQDAYLLAKPPISPEEVQSAHNPVMDWLATLSGPGLLLTLVFGVLLTRVGAAVVLRPQDERHTAAHGVTVRAVLLAIGLYTLATVQLDHEALTEWVIATRLGGVTLLAIVALGVLHATQQRPAAGAIALASAAITLAAHGMIEVTGTNQQAAGLWWALLGIAAGGSHEALPGARPFSRLRPALAPWLVLALVATASRTVTFLNVEALLRSAAQDCRPVAEIGNLVLAAREEADPLRRQELRQEASAIINKHVPPGTSPDRAEVLMRLAAIEQAGSKLQGAQAATEPTWSHQGPRLWTHWPIARERQRLALAAMQLRGGPTAQERAGWLAEVESEASGRRMTTAWSWLATVYAATAKYPLDRRYTIAPEANPPASLEHAIDLALARSQTLDPYNPMHAQRRLELARQQGWTDQIRARAAELLALDDLQRLDRDVRGLSATERARVEELAKGLSSGGR